MNIKERFKVEDKGKLKHFLGLEINHDEENNVLEISQERYVRKILKKFGFENCYPAAIPIDPGINIESGSECDKPCRELVGCLMYLMLGTRPDLSYAVNYLSRFQDKPSEDLWNNLTKTLRYLKKTENYKLRFCKDERNVELLETFVDADWGQDKDDRKSTSGFCIFYKNKLLQWSTKKQNCIALSSAEAELISFCSSLVEIISLEKLLKDLGVTIEENVIYEDNQACIALLKDPSKVKRVKHIDIKLKFTKEEMEKRKIEVKYTKTEFQVADMFTKALGRVKLQTFIWKLFGEGEY